MSVDGDEAFRFLKHVGQLARAAVPSVEFDSLFKSQQVAAERILRSIKSIAVDSCSEREDLRGRNMEDYRAARPGGRGPESVLDRRMTHPLIGRDYRTGHVERTARWRPSVALHGRPHNCFLINGGRGSGKTTVLNYLAECIDTQSFPSDGATKRDRPDHHPGHHPGRGGNHGARTPTAGPPPQRIALLLRVALPNNLEAHESPMEAVFAAVQDCLLLEADRAHEATDYKKDLDATLTEFREQVLVGWTFSRREGMQALAQDALDFNDYAKNRAKFNLYAHKRIDSWLGFVDRLLDTLGFELLVLVFDDMDLQPEAGQRIVEDIRQYMVHPRTVTIVAADMDRLVDGMIREALVANPRLADALGWVDNDWQMHNDGRRSAYLQTFYYDCRQTVLAKIDKVFPPGLRSDLDLRDRSQLDKLLGLSFTKLCVTHFFGHREKRAGERNQAANPAWDEGLAWWLLNAPHSALVTDTMRGYVQFLNGLFHDQFVEHGPDVALPSVAHTPILDVLLTYHKAWSVHQLRANSHDLFEIALRSETQWDWDESRQPGGRTDPFTEHLIDFWLDVRIAMNRLDCRKVPALRQWLPLAIEIPLEKSGKNLLATPEWGINGHFRDGILPRSCLYVYQFRYLDMLAGRIRRDLADSAIRLLRSKFYDDRNDYPISHQSIKLAAELVTYTPTEIVQKIRSPIEAEEGYVAGSSEFVALHIALFCFIHPAEGGKFLEELKGVFQEGRSAILWSDLQEELPAERFALFNKYLDAWSSLEADEQERNFFRTIWILAVHLGVLGTDYRTIKVREFIQDLGFGFRDDESGRLSRLAQHTDKIIRGRSRRTAILLAWSLTPVAEPMLRLGCDRRGDDEREESWKKIQGALEHALRELTKLLAASSPAAAAPGDDRPRTQDADPAADAGAEPAVELENAPERHLQDAQLREWHFPDFSNEQLEAVKEDIAKTIATIGSRSASEAEAPVQPVSYGHKFIDTLTKLTRMNRESAEAIHARLNRP